MAKKRKRIYPSVQAWKEATGTNSARLAKLVGCKPAHLSNVLSKSRRCSVELALKISKITNVPLEAIVEWPAEYEKSA